MSIFALALVSLGAMPPKKTVELSTGITMKYVETGDARGEAVILLHGLTDSSRSFYPMMEHLAALRSDLHLFALDLRGHGESSLPAASECRSAPERCFRPVDLAADVLAFMDARGIERAHIVAHSMSSALAHELALRRPERVLRMAVIAGFASAVRNAALGDYLLAGFVEGPWKEALVKKGYRFPEGVYELTPLDADANAESTLRENWVFDPTADPEFVSAVAFETARTPIGTWLGATRALLEFDARERLSELTVPILVLWPMQDGVFALSGGPHRGARSRCTPMQHQLRFQAVWNEATSAFRASGGRLRPQPPLGRSARSRPRSGFLAARGRLPDEDPLFHRSGQPTARALVERRSSAGGENGAELLDHRKIKMVGEGNFIGGLKTRSGFNEARCTHFRTQRVVPVSFSKYR
jgi:pimeloyl-ACP methyl ester carboxylesterase